MDITFHDVTLVVPGIAAWMFCPHLSHIFPLPINPCLPMLTATFYNLYAIETPDHKLQGNKQISHNRPCHGF